MRAADLPSVMAIEESCFPNPWPEGAFREEMRAPYARCVVARAVGGRAAGPAGYICYWILGEELLINNLAVHPQRRRRGLGRYLLRHALERGCSQSCLVAYLEVRPSNEAAIHLYEAHGFRAVARRRGYYAETNEDALVMRAELPAAPPEGAPPAES